MDSNLEKKYQHIRARKSVFMFRFIFLLLIICFGGYSLCKMTERQSDVYGYTRLAIMAAYCFGFVIFHSFENDGYYYVTVKLFLLILIGIKITIDWIEVDINIGLGSLLISLISTMNLSIDVFYLTFLNLVHLSVFVARSVTKL